MKKSNIHFKLYRDLIGSIPKFQDEFNQSRAFWSLTFQSHLDAAIFRLCKIYDQYSTTLNLRNLLDTIKANIGIFDTENFRARLKDSPFVESLSVESRKPDETQLKHDLNYASQSNPLVQNLTMWRNNFFAHRSAKHVIRKHDLAKDYPLTIEYVEELLVEGTRILNEYSGLFREKTYSTNMVGCDDFEFVLKSIREHLRLIERQIEEEVNRLEQVTGRGDR